MVPYTAGAGFSAGDRVGGTVNSRIGLIPQNVGPVDTIPYTRIHRLGMKDCLPVYIDEPQAYYTYLATSTLSNANRVHITICGEIRPPRPSFCDYGCATWSLSSSVVIEPAFYMSSYTTMLVNKGRIIVCSLL